MRRLDVKREEGVAMAEFALIAPVFLLIVAGLLGFGRVFFYWIETNHLANETARWAIVDRNPYDPKPLQWEARDSATGEFQSDVSVCIDFPGAPTGSPQLGEPLRVKVQKPFNFIPLLGIGQITIRGESTMRIERLAGAPAVPGGPPTPKYYKTSDNVGTCT